jgi:hypothetical protein
MLLVSTALKTETWLTGNTQLGHCGAGAFALGSTMGGEDQAGLLPACVLHSGSLSKCCSPLRIR